MCSIFITLCMMWYDVSPTSPPSNAEQSTKYSFWESLLHTHFFSAVQLILRSLSLMGGGGIHLKSESRSHCRANSSGWVYYKYFCLNTWVCSLKKRPINRQSQILVSHLLKLKKLCLSNIDMWSVYPEEMACYVGVLCSDINLGECILR